ncbi:hypothetical protein BDP27DRAFT_1362048 [Rhodocollybia butyracea]|uniref:Uncharacterized protein n=1 Tax=Rhodocollybia butyracea TaxID=206335 RepID=A0A9P5PY73_9AGAR|nr:hypothetical protein BDP27DRAFT_1362048 [Rhodocollybia butyracea]
MSSLTIQTCRSLVLEQRNEEAVEYPRQSFYHINLFFERSQLRLIESLIIQGLIFRDQDMPTRREAKHLSSSAEPSFQATHYCVPDGYPMKTSVRKLGLTETIVVRHLTQAVAFVAGKVQLDRTFPLKPALRDTHLISGVMDNRKEELEFPYKVVGCRTSICTDFQGFSGGGSKTRIQLSTCSLIHSVALERMENNAGITVKAKEAEVAGPGKQKRLSSTNVTRTRGKKKHTWQDREKIELSNSPSHQSKVIFGPLLK